MALVIYGSLATSGPVVEVNFYDKYTHLISYAVLGAYFGGMVKHRTYWIVLLLLFGMSVALEFLQEAGGERVFDTVDMFFNAAGLVLAALACRMGLNRWCTVLERWVFP